MHNIPNHFVEQISDTEQLVHAVRIIPLEVVVRNAAAGSLCRRLGWKEGRRLSFPIVEYYYKDDSLGDPLLTEDHIYLLNIATKEEVAELRSQSLMINTCLIKFLSSKQIKLIDFKLEFGRASNNSILLADEISPDTCRFWDFHTNKKLDKDRFRDSLGGVFEAYQEIYDRILCIKYF